MISYFKNLSNVKKLVVYIASSVISGAVDAGLVPVRFEHYVQLATFFLTSIGIYALRNNKPSVDSAVAAAAGAVSTAASGEVPSLDELDRMLADLKSGDSPALSLAGNRHEAPESAASDPAPAAAS